MTEDNFLNEKMIVLPNFGWKKTFYYSESKKRRELTSHPVLVLKNVLTLIGSNF
jgi:hypothetical protein